MMYLVTADQMRIADRRTIEEFGLPGMVLMENAAQGSAAIIEDHLDGMIEGLDLAAFCGRGNNGGDGLAICRILANRGAMATAYLFCKGGDLKGDAASNLAAARACGVEVIEIPDDEAFAHFVGAMSGHEYYVDALLGTGLNSEVKGRYARAIELMNLSTQPVLAVDIPSGLNAGTGEVMGAAVQADNTATFGLVKLGLALEAGDYVGDLHLVDISIPPQVADELEVTAETLDEELASALLPMRPAGAHKGTHGHLLVVGGSWGLTGAVCLAAWGGLRAGAGLVTVGVPLEFVPIIEAKLTTAMSLPLNQTANRSLGKGALNGILEAASDKQALVLGPGLGRDSSTMKLVRELLENLSCPLVLDADGLFALGGGLAGIKPASRQLVLTPHPGEAARLLDSSSAGVQADRAAAARRLAKESGSVVVLKGACSVVAEPQGNIWVNQSGNQLLAAGGSGDVLAGLIGGLMAQGLPALEAACLGTYVHGLAADLATADYGRRGLSAEELPAYLPQAFDSLDYPEDGEL
jgi:hydroxyethylthiazole kinase-like uncharacterized protein yjeF